MANRAIPEDSCVVRRVVAAPPEVVYRVWTEPELAAKWSWGREFETISVEIDCRPGGKFRQQIRDKKTGENWFFEGIYREVDPPKKLVHTFHFKSDRGKDEPVSLVCIELNDSGNGTEVVITHTQLADEHLRNETEKGWVDVLECVEKAIATVPT